MNLKPTIVLSSEGLEAIKYIVSKAPQEAQWFNTVEPIVYKNIPGEVFLHLSDKLYIPKQNTSMAQVDSTGAMMMEFYNELKEKHTFEEVNNIISNMTCWSHSHHNMSPNPSAQDDSQFNQLVSMSQDQNLNKYQIMLIFNKKDQFYSRIYDPNTGLIVEGVDIIVENSYDFSYIDDAAKQKFLKPSIKKTFTKKLNFSKKPTFSYLEDRLHNALNEYETLTTSYLDSSFEDYESLSLNYIEDIFFDIHPDLSYLSKLLVQPSTIEIEETISNMEAYMSEKEILWFSFLVSSSEDKIKNVFTDKQVASYYRQWPKKVDQKLKYYLSTTNDSLQDFKEKIITILKIKNCNSSKELKGMF